MSKVTVLDMANSTGGLTEQFGTMADIILKCADVAKEDADIVFVAEGQELPNFDEVTSVIISGSMAMVTDKPDWAMRASEWLKEAEKRNIPMLGICFGHQLLAYTFGGKVDWHPCGMQFKTKMIEVTKEGETDLLMSKMPKTFLANVGNSQSVTQLPPGAVRVCTNETEVNASFRLKDNIWGIQFHPEINDEYLKAILLSLKDSMATQGIDTMELLKNIQPTHCCAILKNFVELAQ